MQISSTASNLLILLILSTAMPGRATYTPEAYVSRIGGETLAKEGITESKGNIDLRFLSLADEASARKYLGISPDKSRMIPAVLQVRNKDSQVIKIDFGNSFLQTGSGEKLNFLSIDEAIKRALRSDAEVVGWTVGFGLVGGILAADHTASTNQSLEIDYHAKCFKPSIINSEKIASGIVFIDYPKSSPLDMKLIKIRIAKLDSGDEFDFEINPPHQQSK